MPLPALLKKKDFTKLLVGLTASTAADGLLFIALPLWVFAATRSPLQTSLTFAVQAVPRLLLGPLGGAFADIHDKRRILVGSYLIRFLLITLMVIALHLGSLIGIYTLLALEAALSTLARPASMALIPALTPTEDLQAANGLVNTGFSISQLVSPALGTLLLSLMTTPSVVLVAMSLYLLSLGCVMVLSEEAGRSFGKPLSLYRSILEGLCFVVQHQQLLAVVVSGAAIWLGQGLLLSAAIPWLASNPQTSESSFGLLVSALGIGMVLGGFLLSTGARWTMGKVYQLGLLGSGILLALAALQTNLLSILSLFIAVGITFMLSNSSGLTLLQQLSGSDQQGRVYAISNTLSEGARLSGILMVPLLLAQTTPSWVIALAGVVTLLAIPIYLRGAHIPTK